MSSALKTSAATDLVAAKSAGSIGVDLSEVQRFVDHCMDLGKELHSILVIRHGQVACEAYRKPYGPEYRHMMYSVSKSFTSTAIGFAIDEGLITLETRLVDVFPEIRGSKPNKNLEKLNVDNLLSMRSGLQVSVFMDKTKDRWFHDIINSQWVSEPGTDFLYVSENMYLLCAIIHKVAGMSVMDYLKPRLFEPLGIENPFWETDPRGIEAGGWGMMIKTRDLAKFTLCYLNGGKYNGKQVIPEWYAKTAVAFHADNSKPDEDTDSNAGYGYCFWRNKGHKDSFRADGMFSQFGIGFEDLDACVIITAGEVDEQAMRDVVWDHFPKAFVEPFEDDGQLEVSIPEYKPLVEKPHSFLEKQLEGKVIKFSKTLLLNVVGFPVSTLTLPAVFMESDKAGNISNVSFKFMGDHMLMTWSENEEINTVEIGMDGQYRWSRVVLGGIEYNTCSAACWHSETELEIQIRAIETVAERRMLFRFRDSSVTMKPSSVPTVDMMVETLKNTIREIITQPAIQNLASSALPYAAQLIDATHKGKII